MSLIEVLVADQDPNRRILVVDDNPAIHDDFHKILNPADAVSEGMASLELALFGEEEAASAARFALDDAYQGSEGLDKVRESMARKQPYAVAFVDVRMPPGWDGITTAGYMLREDPNLQIVICTAYSDHSWEDISRALGSTDRVLILKKPFDTLEVRQLAQALTTKRSLSERATYRLADLESMVDQRTQELAAANLRLRADIETQARLELELRLAQKLEAVGQLAAGIAHEINTPIQYVGDSIMFLQQAFGALSSALAGYRDLTTSALTGAELESAVAAVQALEDDLDIAYIEEQTPIAIDCTVEGIQRVATIVRAMKEFAHSSEREKGAVNINRALETTLAVARGEYKLVADTRTELEEELPLVHCHASDINQVFLNLIVNAAHAVGEALGDSTGRGTITVRTRLDGDGVVISVEDTGCGIPTEIRERIFDPFFTTKPIGRGTGQGLAIAHAIVVERHGGQLRFETEVGRGTTFIVRLPISAPQGSG